MADRAPDAGRGVKRPHDETTLDTVPLRTGQWTSAEMAFANRVIEYFDKGSLPNCTNGTTLRALLADILHCSPMRISKKYAGDGAIGKRTFTKLSAIDKTQLEELRALELEFHESLQGRARWPLVEWKTLLLGRTGSTGPRTAVAPPPPPPPSAPRQPMSPGSQQHESRYGEPALPILGAPGPRPTYMMQPPAVPTPPRGQREVRYSLHKLKEHCQPISLGRLSADPPVSAPATSTDIPEESWHQFSGGGGRTTHGTAADAAAAMHREVYDWIPRDLGVPVESDPLSMTRILEPGPATYPQEETSRRRIMHPGEAQQQLQGQLQYSSATSPFPPDQPLTAETVQQELRRRIQEQQQPQLRGQQPVSSAAYGVSTFAGEEDLVPYGQAGTGESSIGPEGTAHYDSELEPRHQPLARLGPETDDPSRATTAADHDTEPIPSATQDRPSPRAAESALDDSSVADLAPRSDGA